MNKEKDKYCVCECVCVYHMLTQFWNLGKSGIDDLTCKVQIETDVENKGMDTKRERGNNWEIGVDAYTVLVLSIK